MIAKGARGKRVKRISGDARAVDLVRYGKSTCVIAQLKPGEVARKAFRGARPAHKRLYGCFASTTAAAKRADVLADAPNLNRVHFGRRRRTRRR